MPAIKIECQYCGHRYRDYVYSAPDTENLKCVICKDGNLKISRVDSEVNDHFGYNYTGAKPDAYIKK